MKPRTLAGGILLAQRPPTTMHLNPVDIDAASLPGRAVRCARAECA